mmetsp:Transcript_18028/g.43320  ORF Transcript_18028/g.43320 Transcript_18028/m.43320 type:complete len:81 (+) Transcript_18028:109-351(+)
MAKHPFWRLQSTAICIRDCGHVYGSITKEMAIVRSMPKLVEKLPRRLQEVDKFRQGIGFGDDVDYCPSTTAIYQPIKLGN